MYGLVCLVGVIAIAQAMRRMRWVSQLLGQLDLKFAVEREIDGIDHK
jgi:hypothetical protein